MAPRGLIEIPWDEQSSRGELSQATKFTLFPRLPPEIRYKIWRAACTPRSFPARTFEILQKWKRKGYHGLSAPLPATARVNQEARAETLQVYSEIPHTPSWNIQGFINYEVDTMRFSCDYSAFPASMYPAAVLQNLQRISIVPKCWELDCQPKRASFKTIENFLLYVAAKHFPSLREVDIGIPSQMEQGRESFLSAPRRAAQGMSRSVCPLFFRAADGRGVKFLPTTNYWGGWDAMNILIMEEKEAARIGDGDDRSEHQAFLDYMGLCLWHVFLPGGFLFNDREVKQLAGDDFYTRW
ncbi:hypothetical protein PG984_004916 [Apiospora sp. TS-2023a]